MSLSESIASAISNMAAAVKAAFDAKKQTNEWRQSDEKKKYDAAQQDKLFNKSLETGDTKTSDAIRKDKQNKIKKELQEID